MKAWCNGELIDSDSPAVSVLDHGLTVGDGVFETMKAMSGKPFALTRHIKRLQRSARGLGIREPHAGVVADAVSAAVAANRTEDLAYARIRVTYTSGPGPLGSERGAGPETLVVTVQLGQPWPETTEVIVSPWPRNERSPLAGLKTTSYAENAVALTWAKDRGFSEALLINLAGDLCEGTGSNVFVVVDGQLFTPSLESGCLDGITRQLLVEWSRARETTLPADVLQTAQEVFITSSTRDVHPVVAVGDRRLEVGPVTTQMRALFAERSTADLDP